MTRGVLLFGAESSAAEDVVDAARDLGVSVHLATHSEVYDRYSDGLRKKFTGTVFTDFRSPQTALEELELYCTTQGISGVLVGWEFLSPLATRLAARLGLPGHDVDRADAVRNKGSMAELFGKYAVPSPLCVAATSVDAAAAGIRAGRLAFPLVVKPAENAGSVGVAVIDSLDELPEAFERARQWSLEFPYGIPLDTTVLVQEYLEGPEFSIETVAFEGAFDHLAIVQKFTTGGGICEETGHTVPAQLDSATRASVLDVVEQGLTALGVRNGVTHTELKVTPDGPRIIEVGARPPGGHIMKVVEHATGISEARSYVQAAIGRRPDTRPLRTGAAAIRFISTPEHGVFSGLSGAHPTKGVVALQSYAAPGDRIGNDYERFTRIGHVIVRASSPAQANQLADDVVAGISIDLEN
ncbi:ATP-grasp domain-containing protein [Streptomyces sp. CA-278952]|uniref:ATP-grasp domain-containing protein n=1 Tax=Streptomyces sp. CA-278952 TaxID=2980556 RepID=UPI0023679949|nr:ATP-grasp domain-containing protein [Streptomyces sp. CA-278952]WDG28947.1 ATP-grasp domain-containing protein [Streptomyces sp. CA-278952]